ncbi:MAG: RdgB/HAM1 family non-canonical purine NTP pyrophosphatase, partial [Thermoplasmatota archaeon]
IEVKLLKRDFVETQVDTLEEVIHFGVDHLVEKGEVDAPFIKDDSGLFVNGLNGFPGVYSSYVQRTVGNGGIIRLMEGMDDRRATFRTVIGLHIPGSGLSMFTGECHGNLTSEERGKQGFGYDPIFVPQGEDRTFAEMSVEEKNSISHRIMAIRRLVDFISRDGSGPAREP